MINQNFAQDLTFAIKGPDVTLPVPTYNIDEKRLIYSLESED